ncbi:hypothetical protein JOQ06_016884, partial [Pogonophryne albipinna]
DLASVTTDPTDCGKHFKESHRHMKEDAHHKQALFLLRQLTGQGLIARCRGMEQLTAGVRHKAPIGQQSITKAYSQHISINA